MNEYREKVILVGILLDDANEDDYRLSMEELGNLANACNMEVAGVISQRLEYPNKALYVGPGKVREIAMVFEEKKADIVVFDNTLSPTQIRNLQKELSCPIMDRNGLILEIFESRAKSREARLQVQVAKLQYMLPRLVGLHEALSRQGGGGGSRANKGAGEKKLELDRRKLEHRLNEFKRELKDIKAERLTQRKKRSSSGILRAALVGYTNAGKSTLMNAMLDTYYKETADEKDKLVFEKDMLFATLDTTVRRIEPKGFMPFLLSDTVGFVSNLPHNLIEAFHSTLEEALEADILLHVIDCSDVNYKQQIAVTEKTLEELGAKDTPVIYIFNKADKCMDQSQLPKVADNRIYISAKKRIGLEDLLKLIELTLSESIKKGTFVIPYELGHITSYMQSCGGVKSVEYLENGTKLEVVLRKSDSEKYKEFYCTES